MLQSIFGGFFDTAYAVTDCGIESTTEGQIAAEQQVIARWNAEAEKAGWDVRLEQYGPALPDMLYYVAPTFNGPPVYPAPPGAPYKLERWRKLGLEPSPPTSLRLHYEAAKVNGVLIPEKQGPVISKEPDDSPSWALPYRPVGGVRFIVGDISTIKLKRGTWLSDVFTLLWLRGEEPNFASHLSYDVAPRAEYQEPYQPELATFRREAAQQWWRRLRKRKSAEFWAGLANEPVEWTPEEYWRRRVQEVREAVSYTGQYRWDGKIPTDEHGESERGWKLAAHKPFPLEYSGVLGKYREPAPTPKLRLRTHSLPWAPQTLLYEQWDRLCKIDCGINIDCPTVRPFDKELVKLRREETKPESNSDSENTGISYVAYQALYAARKKGADERAIVAGKQLRYMPDKVWEKVGDEPRGGKVIHPEGCAVRLARLAKDQEAYNAKYESLWNARPPDAPFAEPSENDAGRNGQHHRITQTRARQ